MAKAKFIPIPKLSNDDQSRFWAKVRSGDSDECWEWTGGRQSGYGVFHIQTPRYNFKASRISYFLATGKDPKENLVCHHCDNPPCCNPAHLFLGTSKDNSQDAQSKNRLPHGEEHWTALKPELLARGDRSGSATHPEMIPRGERNGNAKLSDEQVQAIRTRRANGEKVVPLATEFGVSPALICHICLGRAWNHVSGERIQSSRHVKVTEELAMQIKDLCRQGINHRLIAEQFGVSRNHVSGIACGHRWKHIP